MKLRRRAATLVCLLAFVPGCDGEPPVSGTATELANPAAEAGERVQSASRPATPPAALPLIVEEQAQTHTARAEFPAGLGELAPVLDESLRADALRAFAELASLARSEAALENEYFSPYELDIRWIITASAGNLISLEGVVYSNTGGAHPNHVAAGLIFDTARQADVGILDLFADREAALRVLVPLVRAEITRAKMLRYDEAGDPSAERLAETEESLPMSGDWLTQVVLVPSTQAGRFGGLKVHFSPYDLGSYAEGAYEATVSQVQFRDTLRPEIAEVFSGSPAPYGADKTMD